VGGNTKLQILESQDGRWWLKNEAKKFCQLGGWAPKYTIRGSIPVASIKELDHPVVVKVKGSSPI